jgi:hypothetical protein
VKATPTVEINNVVPTQETISFELDVTDTESILHLKKIEFYDGNLLLNTKFEFTEISFENLFFDTEYQVKVYYEYDLNDGEGIQEKFNLHNIKTSKDPYYSLLQKIVVNKYVMFVFSQHGYLGEITIFENGIIDSKRVISDVPSEYEYQIKLDYPYLILYSNFGFANAYIYNFENLSIRYSSEALEDHLIHVIENYIFISGQGRTTGKVIMFDKDRIDSQRVFESAKFYGSSILISGNHLFIANKYYLYPKGAVDIYKLDDLNYFSRIEYVDSQHFGQTIKVNDRFLFIGDYGDNSYRGAVYVYDFKNEELVKKISSENGKVNEYFGYYLDFDQEFLYIEAHGYLFNTGAVYKYDMSNFELVEITVGASIK